MRLVGRPKLETFLKEHTAARHWIQAWVAEVEEAAWNSPQDIKDRYSSASFLKDNTVVFNVKGNQYRLICIVAYKTQVVVVDWIGTHAKYSKLY